MLSTFSRATTRPSRPIQPNKQTYMTILELQKAAESDLARREIHVQVTTVSQKTTQGGKPYIELEFVDATGTLKLRCWNNHPAYSYAQKLTAGLSLCVTGDFRTSDFGIEADYWAARELTEDEKAAMLTGSEALREKQTRDWYAILDIVNAMQDPAYRDLCIFVLREYGGSFRRAAAARGNHHARRGGLVEHVSMMMQAAVALATVYGPEINRDLLLAGTLLHDIGKLWENDYEQDGFTMPFTEFAELYGH